MDITKEIKPGDVVIITDAYTTYSREYMYDPSLIEENKWIACYIGYRQSEYGDIAVEHLFCDGQQLKRVVTSTIKLFANETVNIRSMNSSDYAAVCVTLA
jgi:hypothetical protein